MVFKTMKAAVVISLLLLYSSSKASDVTVGGFLYIFGTKALNPEVKTGHNLDMLLGLGDVSLTAKSGNFQGFMEVYLWPTGYGFTYVESAVLDSATKTIVTKEANAPSVTVVNAWGRFTTNYLQVQIGRALLKYSNGFFFGDYLQRGSGPIIDNLGNMQNCLSFQNTTGIFTTSVLLGVGDFYLDKGYMTLREIIQPTAGSEVALGYQGNVFDRVQNSEAVVLSNLSLSGRFDYTKGQKVYAEFGVRGLGASRDDDKRFPVMLGFSVPTSELLTDLTFEAEYDEKRESVDKLNSLSFGVSAMKMFNNNFMAIVSLNNGLSKKTEIVGLNCELLVLF